MFAHGRIELALTALVLALHVAAGQETRQSSPRIWTRHSSFRLPVKIDDRDRETLKELKLFMKTGDAPWSCVETAPAQQKSFSFRAAADGEYKFHIATVDLQRRMIPAQPDREPPGIIVVVDTRAPQAAVTAATTPSGQPALLCQLNDANLDKQSLRVEIATAEGWRRLTADRSNAALFPVANAAALAGKVRVHAEDRAGNVLEKVFDLGATAKKDGVDADAVVVAKIQPAQVPSLVEVPKEVRPRSLPITSDAAVKPVALAEPVAPLPIVNSRRCSLDYQIANAPAVNKVEVWLTADSGRSWQLGGESSDANGVATVQFPGDGVYGYRFAIKTPSNTDATPLPGEAPEGSVEIDTVAPELTLLAATPGPDRTLRLRWRATDRNLGPKPISLYYSLSRNGEWMPICPALENSGAHTWSLPANCGPNVHLRVQVRDRAGNLAEVETREPIQLNTGKPAARVLDWRPAP